MANYHGKKKKIPLVEASAPPELSVVLEKIPDDLKWKFKSNYDSAAQRYWLKLTYETRDEKHGPSQFRKKNRENLKQLKKELESLLMTCLEEQSEYHLWCEARFGKVDWRASEDDLKRNLTVKDISSLRKREFYTRTTTKTKEMIDKFRPLCSLKIEEPIIDMVVLTVEDTAASKEEEEEEVRYKILLNEYQGKFSFYSREACEQHTKNLKRLDADFICVGRSYDVRISSVCKFEQTMPPDVIESIDEICKSIQRIDGKLRMILKHGSVKVKFVRQMRTWDIILKDQKHDVNFYELKETNTDGLPEDEVVDLEHNENQEIEVKLIRKVNDPSMIQEILTEVEDLVDFSMDVMNMAEECKDPATPH